MKVTLEEHRCLVEREPHDRPIRGGSWGSPESALWGRVRDALRAQGHDVVRRRMSADGHMYGDDRLPYVRERAHRFYVYDGMYAVRDVVQAYWDGGRVELLVQRNEPCTP